MLIDDGDILIIEALSDELALEGDGDASPDMREETRIQLPPEPAR